MRPFRAFRIDHHNHFLAQDAETDLACFAIVPALMASAVYVRPPVAMRHFFVDLIATLDLPRLFPEIHFSHQTRDEFIAERSAFGVDPRGSLPRPLTDAVIFTGTLTNAETVRKAFDPSVLFIHNGAGHNPLIVTRSADISAAVAGAMRVQLYNSGQDCANPNAILVHTEAYDHFMRELRQAVAEVRVGPYDDHSNRVGPLSEHKALEQVQSFLVDNARWLDPSTRGTIHSGPAIVEPTIIAKPLADGGNYTEHFAPIFIVQRYNEDSELARYFETAAYAMNAMYITVFGHSAYIDGLIGRPMRSGRVLHEASSVIRDTHLHAPGVERGTQPYGGFGRGASSISVRGVFTPKPTLPQRDIYEQLVQPAAP